MILFRYTKTDGAEYLSHLDLLRHLGRIFRRAEIDVKSSQGFHPHLLVYMSAPIGVGMKSLAEYCLVETDEKAEGFREKFNAQAPRGVRCVEAWYTEKKVGVASDIAKAEYTIRGINPFDTDEFMKRTSFVITTKSGAESDVRDRIYEVKNENGVLRCVLGFGNGLRAEKFADVLVKEYGGERVEIIKERALLENGKPFEEILR